jgi:hypothetical protein
MGIGDRVVVSAGPQEGTDHQYDGRTGTVIEADMLIAVRFDDPPPGWPKVGVICRHNLRLPGAC